MGIDFTGPFLRINGMNYINVMVYYLSKWVNAVELPNNEGKSVTIFLNMSIFFRFGMTRAIISDEGSHFCNILFCTILEKHGVKNKV